MASTEIRKIEENKDVASLILYRDSVTPFRKSFITVGEDKMSIAISFKKYVEEFKNLEVYQSDVFIASFPKTGTTWLSEMVWMICNDMNFEKGRELLAKRVPFLEMCGIYDQEEMQKSLKGNNPEFINDSIGFIRRLKEPRLIKTHLPFSLLPLQIQNNTKQPKILYITRNPKDVCVSYYHHAKLLEGYRGNLEDFRTLFLTGKVQYGPFWNNVMGYWKRRHWPNILILQYEQLITDLPSMIKKVALFLEKPLTDKQIEILAKHLNFESMRRNKSVNGEEVVEMRKKQNLVVEDGHFLRSGKMDDYKEEMNFEMINKFDAWIKEKVAGTDFDLYT
ncbi:hypothetical protein ILUMI_23181 [Ignelater luminosus]|uniref:Sulfotransferase domain-containing protein n=1 Tax=Ignelater luminosus TaxID=2038154 RepID=A0A8K0FZV3_IGNLU|nr:hypothetical protein ILUMI_23181 [Ignelater luminosus]